MRAKDFKVGQTVWVEVTGNMRRNRIPEECIEEWEITSVGRKYIKAAKKGYERLFNEITFEYSEGYGRFVEKTQYSPDYMMYETRKEIEDKHEYNRLSEEISKAFRLGGRKFTLEQLRRIKEILCEESEVV